MHKVTLFSCILFTVGLSTLLPGQQPAHFTLIGQNPYYWNPGAAGLSNSINISGVYRQQWPNLEGGPLSQYLTVHMPAYILNGGFGLYFENDALGAEKTSRYGGALNYQKITGQGILSLGVSAGIIQRSLDGSLLRTPGGNYERNTNVNHNDPLLPVTRVSGQSPTFDLGLYYYSEKWEAGVSIHNVNESEIPLGDLKYINKRSYFAGLGYHGDLTSKISFHPYFFMNTDAVQFQTNLSLLFVYNENLSLGGALRGYNSQTLDAASLLLGLRISPNLQLFYAYDSTLSPLQPYTGGAHEIMLKYTLQKTFGQGRLPKIIHTPRLL